MTVLAGPGGLQPLSGWKLVAMQILIGFAGGAIAAVAKYYMRDHADILELMRLEQVGRAKALIVGYCLGGLALGVLGAAAAWYSAQVDPRKLFFVGISAPSIISAMIPGLDVGNAAPKVQRGSWMIEQLSPVSPAYAQASDESCIGDNPILKGFKLFFGIQEKYDRYRIIVGSKRDFGEAEVRAKTLNSSDPSLKAYTAPRRCESEFYPIVVGDSLPLDEAKKQLEKVRQSIPDAYLSPVPRS